MLRHSILSFAIVCGAVIVLSGCSGGPSETEQRQNAAEINNLDAIQVAYMAYLDKNQRPPQKPEDLKSYFADDVDVQKVYSSTRDGQPYVIAWGTDPRKQTGVNPLVIAYEKEGKNDVRMVFSAFGVVEMDKTEFEKASFPPGIKP